MVGDHSDSDSDGELEDETSAIDRKLTYGNYIKNWGKNYLFGGTREVTEFEKTIVVHGYF